MKICKIKISLFISVIILTLFSLAFSQEDFSTQYQSAIEKFNKKDYSSARELFSSLLPTAPSDKKGECYLYLLKSSYFLKDHNLVAQVYSAHQQEFQGTSIEPDGMFVYANSLLYYKKDYIEAKNVYEQIVSNFPNSKIPAQGSTLSLGVIKIQHLDKVEEGIAQLRGLINQNPELDYAGDAYVEIIKGYYNLKDRTAIEKTRDEFFVKCSNSPRRGDALFQLAEYCGKVEKNRDDAILFYTECYKKYPECPAATKQIAKIRSADLVPFNDINISISLYKEILSKSKSISKEQKSWCQFELAFAHILKGENENARELLNTIINDEKASAKMKSKAQKYLKGLNEPESYEGAKLSVDSAIRYRRELADTDLEAKSYAHYIGCFKKGIFDSYLNDPTFPITEKSVLLYDLSLSYYYNGDSIKAFEIAQDIIKKYPDGGYGYEMARFMEAFILSKSGKIQQAIEKYLSLLNDSSGIKIAPRILKEIGYCFSQLDLSEQAISAYDAISFLYPYRVESKEAKNIISFIIYGNEKLQIAADKLKIPRNNNMLSFINAQKNNKDKNTSSLFNTIDKIRVYLAEKPEKELDFEDRLTSLF